MKDFILEVCADSVESVLAGERGGATRIELCGNLVIGGTTPSPKLFEEIRKHSHIRMHVLIRPRFGDFCYTAYEYSMIKEEVKMFRELGAEGVVIGILKPEGTLNMEAMHGLMEEAAGMSVTLHRAFDMSADPYETMEQAISLGIDTILTSGQKNVCTEGIPLLKCLKEKSGGRICIQAGGGVNAGVIPMVYQSSGVTAYHMSGKAALDSAMRYRKEEVNMGLPSLSEYTIYRTREENIRQARQVLEEM
ncbi:copper homeostasis protein CutC [Anaerocolumna xylanovorans]|uniref:PF03932 family protein CutC n=1 Tax=Anaerocolumna xylanovorans DSM 12503 TaxID=1121345 RepID=A0A1M7Y9D6_9FIRM|nr:copper homeostasis protein CutC [Anaerocolumna xylanovorans]SHO49227.1 copper homeostasis protein [Anaerocolumna xylanovorans DSM 12503]